MTPRIGVAFHGDPLDPQSWSGTTAAVAAGLEEAGARVAPLTVDSRPLRRLNDRLGRTFADIAASRVDAAALGAIGARAVRRAGRLDGVVQMGSAFLLPPAAPIVTYDDLTVRQALALPDVAYGALGARAGGRWVARQRAIYERARACCVGSGWAARSVVEDYGIAADRVHVVGFSLPPDVTPGERDWSVPRFLFIGREWERKNGPRVLAAFARLRAERPDARLDLVGGHPPVEAPGVTGHGRLRLGVAGERARVLGLLREATCLVLPSRFEAFGIAYLEAGATGAPSIGTTVGGAADAVGPGGRLVDPGSEDDLVAAMRELSDPATAQRLGALAAEHAARFTRRHVAERLLRALRPPGVDLPRLAPFLDAAPG